MGYQYQKRRYRSGTPDKIVVPRATYESIGGGVPGERSTQRAGIDILNSRRRTKNEAQIGIHDLHGGNAQIQIDGLRGGLGEVQGIDTTPGLIQGVRTKLRVGIKPVGIVSSAADQTIVPAFPLANWLACCR